MTEPTSAAHAKRLADAKARRADVTTPIAPPTTLGNVPLAALPDPPPLFSEDAAPAPAAAPARSITLATTVGYRDYQIVVTATGMTLDQFCDMLDRRLGVLS